MLRKIHAWVTAWSEMARTVITRRDQMIKLGIAKRRPRAKVATPVVATPAPPPVATPFAPPVTPAPPVVAPIAPIVMVRAA